MELGVAIVDVCAGLTAAIAVLGALHAHVRTRRGRHCEVSLHDVGLQMLISVASNHLASGEEARRYGNSHPNIVPYRTFSAVDGEVAVRSAMTGNSPRLRRPWVERSGRVILASPAIRIGCETVTPSTVE